MNRKDITIERLSKMLIECYMIAEYTGIFVARNFPKHCQFIKTDISDKSDEVEICDEISKQFSKVLLEHYNKHTTLISNFETDLLPASYKVVQELEAEERTLKTTIVEDDNIPQDEAWKITFPHNASPAIYIHRIDHEYVYWSMDLGNGYAEKFNIKYSGSVIDGMLEAANG